MGKAWTVVRREVREAIPPLIFFLVAFHMIAITQAAILADRKITGASTAIATVAALIVAKVILIVEKLPFSRLFGARPLWNIAWKTVLFAAVATLFRFVEELIHYTRRHGTVGKALEEMASEASLTRFLIIQMWLFAFLFLYNLATALVRLIGPENVRELLLELREPPPRSPSPS